MPRSKVSSRKLMSIMLATFMAVLLLYPFETVIVPVWRVRIVDAEGKPFIGKFVRQSWKHYSLQLGAGDNEEDRWTDTDGYVTFPERTIKACLLQRALFTAWANLRTLWHGSTGVSADVMVWGEDNYPREVKYTPGHPLPDLIVLPR